MKYAHWRQFVASLLIPFALTACVEKETVQIIPDAENILFTDDQRLIVSGGENIYEIKPNGASFSKRSLFQGEGKIDHDDCNFTGIAQHENWLFTSCVSTKFLIFTNNHLLAANLDDEDFQFKMITNPSDYKDPYDRLVLPNGLAFAPDGALLVADYNLFGPSGVARIDLDYSGELPAIAGLEKDFVSPAEHGVSSPNGVRVDGQALYLSDANTVKRFKFDEAGRIPVQIENAFGELENNGKTLWSQNLAIVDDIMPYCGGVALTSFVAGSLHYVASYVDESGQEHFPEIYATLPFSYDSPSALAIGAMPGVFDADSLLVTEKGLLMDHNSNLGNKLVVSPLTMDLDDPNACNVIADLAREAIEG